MVIHVRRIFPAVCGAAVFSFVLSSTTFAQDVSTNQYSELRSQILKLAKECSPAPGTRWEDVLKVWNNGWPETLCINTIGIIGEETKGASILIPLVPNYPGPRRVCLSARVTSGRNDGDRVVDSSLFVTDIGRPFTVEGSKIQIPTSPTEKDYLTDAVLWLEGLKKTLERKETELGLSLTNSQEAMIGTVPTNMNLMTDSSLSRILTRPTEAAAGTQITILFKSKSGLEFRQGGGSRSRRQDNQGRRYDKCLTWNVSD